MGRTVECCPVLSQSLGPPRILVADDDRLLRTLISKVLGAAGFHMRTVSDGEEAWELIGTHHYDMLLTDCQMPRLTGLELITRIRESGMTIPIILMSATVNADWVSKNPRQKISAVIEKPFSAFALADTVRDVLQAGSCGVSHNHQSVFRPTLTTK